MRSYMARGCLRLLSCLGGDRRVVGMEVPVSFRSAIAGLCTSEKARHATFPTVCSKSLKKLPVVILFVVTAVAAAAVGGWLGGVAPRHAETSITSHEGGTRTRLQLLMTQQQPFHMYPVLSSSVWLKSAWGKNCSTPTSQLSPGQRALCQLPSIWKDCTQGVYLDVGTNVGVQLRKLYDPWQFPAAPVLELFASTYGYNRKGVCAIGIEANPAHSPYLTVLNAYFKRKGYQAIVLTETAASIKPGEATFYPDPTQTHEWGASLGDKRLKGNKATGTAAVTVSLLDLPAFISEVVKPMALQNQWVTGRRPPLGMKMDVEGEEYALLPALITSGGLCDLDLVFMEAHSKAMMSAQGKAVRMSIASMEKAFARLRKANPRCTVQYTQLDDETYMQADVDVPLPP